MNKPQREELRENAMQCHGLVPVPVRVFVELLDALDEAERKLAEAEDRLEDANLRESEAYRDGERAGSSDI